MTLKSPKSENLFPQKSLVSRIKKKWETSFPRTEKYRFTNHGKNESSFTLHAKQKCPFPHKWIEYLKFFQISMEAMIHSFFNYFTKIRKNKNCLIIVFVKSRAFLKDTRRHKSSALEVLFHAELLFPR